MTWHCHYKFWDNWTVVTKVLQMTSHIIKKYEIRNIKFAPLFENLKREIIVFICIVIISKYENLLFEYEI